MSHMDHYYMNKWHKTMIEKVTGHKRPLPCHRKGSEEFVDSSYPGNWSSSASPPYFSCQVQWLWSIKFHRNWPPTYSKIFSCHRLLHQIHYQKLYVFQDYRSRWNHHLIRVKTTFVQGRTRDVHDHPHLLFEHQDRSVRSIIRIFICFLLHNLMSSVVVMTQPH